MADLLKERLLSPTLRSESAKEESDTGSTKRNHTERDRKVQAVWCRGNSRESH